MGHQSYVLLYTETILSNPPVVQPKYSCDVHLLRSPCVVHGAQPALLTCPGNSLFREKRQALFVPGVRLDDGQNTLQK